MQLMTLVQGPSMRLPDLTHSPEESSRQLSVPVQQFRQGDLLPNWNPQQWWLGLG